MVRGKSYAVQESSNHLLIFSYPCAHSIDKRVCPKYAHSDLRIRQMRASSSGSVLMFAVTWQPATSMLRVLSAAVNRYRFRKPHPSVWHKRVLTVLCTYKFGTGCFTHFLLSVIICACADAHLLTEQPDALPAGYSLLRCLAPTRQP